MQENQTVLENQPGASNWIQVHNNSKDQNTSKNYILHQPRVNVGVISFR